MHNRAHAGLALLIVAAVILGVAATLAGVRWTEHISTPPCLFHKFTGLYCPGCGATRAVRRLAHGDVVGAFRFNPALCCFFIPVATFHFGVWLYDFTRGRRDSQEYRLGSLALALFYLTFLALYFIARNIPLDALEFLRPPGA